MGKIEGIAIIAVASLVAYGIYKFQGFGTGVKDIFAGVESKTQNENEALFSQYNTIQSKLQPGATNVTIGDTTYQIPEGESLNSSQRFLISLDRIIPGTWLSRAVLE